LKQEARFGPDVGLKIECCLKWFSFIRFEPGRGGKSGRDNRVLFVFSCRSLWRLLQGLESISTWEAGLMYRWLS
jgi:hypothetical protein